MPVSHGDNRDIRAARDTIQDITVRIGAACRRANRNVDEVWLIGASKTVPASRLELFLKQGLAHAGENYIQEGIAKRQALGDYTDAHWHFIGSLQSNKAREAVEHFEYIHSVDRTSLAGALDKAAAQKGKVQQVLLQVNLGDEASKAGCRVEDASEVAAHVARCSHLRLCGLMCLPPYQEESEAVRPYFQALRELREKIGSELGLEMPHLSMGMSHDFETAIEEGATMVRVGTALFGVRS